MIKFGTSGWRAIIGDEFTFNNVRLVSKAIAAYIEAERGDAERSLVVGYDTRFLSGEFARAACEVLSENGIKCHLTDRDTPTPVISYHIIKKKTRGAINFTASHNPPEYNGMKFSDFHGAPAPPEATKKIEEIINRLAAENYAFSPSHGKKQSVTEFDPKPEYLKKLKSLVDFEAIKKSRIKIVVDYLNGTGRGYLDLVFDETKNLREALRTNIDPSFGGHAPEPAKENIRLLEERVKKHKAHVGLATDGDADRFGIVDRDTTYIPPNQVICLLFHHLLMTRKKGAKVARTVATTHMIDAIAKAHGIELIETPVGFKFIGQAIERGDCIIGGEESGGLSVMGHLPEKDGILACSLIAEMIAVRKKSLAQLLNELYEKYGKFFNTRIDFSLEGLNKEKIIERLLKNPPAAIGGIKVASKDTIDGYRFTLADQSWALLRFSGTEPIARCYMESKTQGTLNKIAKDMRTIIELS